MTNSPQTSPSPTLSALRANEEFELKSQKSAFGKRVVDGAFRTMCERLAASNNPSLILLNYDLAKLSVRNALLIPKHFFVREIIEERKPLALTARRAGWIGCNILLAQIPAAGKICIVQNGQARPREAILAEWKRTLFLRRQNNQARGWLLEVMRCVDEIGKPAFDLQDVYGFESKLAELYPQNRHVRQKIRQQLQALRDHGYLDFLGSGHYRLRAPR